MTPSGWHDDARNRDAGHDEMQIAVFDWLRASVVCPEGYEKRRGVYFESPFRSRDHIIAWGDIVEVFEKPEHGNYTKLQYVVFEIKPKIYSVGAVVRQCVALADAVDSALKYRRSSGRYSNTVSYDDACVIPVVRSDDPKLSMLRHVWRAMTWDGERLS